MLAFKVLRLDLFNVMALVVDEMAEAAIDLRVSMGEFRDRDPDANANDVDDAVFV